MFWQLSQMKWKWLSEAMLVQKIGLWRTPRGDKKYRQSNDIDCGIFLILYTDCHIRHKPSDFTEDDISKELRLHMTANMIKGFVTPTPDLVEECLENETFVKHAIDYIYYL